MHIPGRGVALQRKGTGRPACMWPMWFATVLALAIILSLQSASAASSGIAAVVSSHIKPFVLALEGFRASVPEEVSSEFVDSNPELVRHRLMNESYSLVVAIGPAAARLAWDAVPAGTPKLCLMVLDPSEVLPGRSLCGVHLRIPPEEQFRLIKERLGSGRRVGVFYNPEENGWWIDYARKAAQQAGVRLVPLAVRNRPEISSMFLASSTQIDTLLFIPDATVISETMITYLIKKALLAGIAPVGFNRFFLEAGAVMSFIIDYEACGRAGGRVAEELLAEGRCTMLPPPFHVGWNDRAWTVVKQAREAAGKRRQGTGGQEQSK